MSDNTLEKLAELEHNQWSEWSQEIATTEKISKPRLERWKAYWKPYAELPEDKKERDREWARKVLANQPQKEKSFFEKYWLALLWGTWFVIMVLGLVVVPIANNIYQHWGWTPNDYIKMENYNQDKALKAAQEKAVVDAAWQVEQAKLKEWRQSPEYLNVIGDIWSQYWWAILLFILMNIWLGNNLRRHWL